MLLRKPFILVAALALAAGPVFSEEGDPSPSESLEQRFVPVASLWLLGGQELAPGSNARTTGLANVMAAFSMRIGERFRVLPSYLGMFQTTRQVLDVGERTILSQSRVDQRVAAKLIFQPVQSPHRHKLLGGFRSQLLREAKDEPLGRGLFDSNKTSLGYEWEYFYLPTFSFRAGYGFYAIRFPNYATLESQGSFRINGQPIARELTGGHVLDSNSHSWLVSANGPLGRRGLMWDARYVFTLRGYPDQRLVDSSGQLAAGNRRDLNHEAAVAVRGSAKTRFARRVVLGGKASVILNRSNQSTYNATDGRFTPGFYDQEDYRVGPHASLYFSHPRKGLRAIQVSSSLEWARRRFPNRPVQDSTGAYGSGSIKMDTTDVTASFSVPVARHLNLMGTLRYTETSSNMAFEDHYRYNYLSKTYLLGFGYDF